MKRLLLPLIASMSLLPSVKAEVDFKIHKLCLPAKDYEGCVKAMLGETNNRLIIQEGSKIAEGNSCPKSFAYVGNGYCKAWFCSLHGKNHPDLAGKDHYCGNADFWSTGYIGRMVLAWKEETVPATIDPSCPAKPPDVGWTSSCAQAIGPIDGPPEKAIKKKDKKNSSIGSVKINCNSPVWKNKPRCN